MDKHDKAKAGVWMLKQAILDLLSERGAMRSAEVEDALGLPSQVGYGMLVEMASRHELDKEDDRHPRYLLPGQPQRPSTQS